MVKKKLYLTHPNKEGFREKLYTPLRKSGLNSQYDIILPHELDDSNYDSLSLFGREPDNLIVLAECSGHATGRDTELAFAFLLGIPIIGFYKKGRMYSTHHKTMSNAFFQYRSKDDMISRLEVAINALQTIPEPMKSSIDPKAWETYRDQVAQIRKYVQEIF